MITLKEIQKSYGPHQVLKDVNLNIHQGEIYGLIGKNGVGKTTIFKIILGLSEFEHGKISVAGSKSNNDLHWNGWASLGTTGCRYFISSIGYYPISGHIKEENSYTRTENCLMICNCLNIAHNERCILINIGGIYFVILKIYHCNEYACPPSP